MNNKLFFSCAALAATLGALTVMMTSGEADATPIADLQDAQADVHASADADEGNRSCAASPEAQQIINQLMQQGMGPHAAADFESLPFGISLIEGGVRHNPDVWGSEVVAPGLMAVWKKNKPKPNPPETYYSCFCNGGGGSCPAVVATTAISGYVRHTCQASSSCSGECQLGIFADPVTFEALGFDL